MRPIFARPDGELEVLGGFRPAARSGGRVLNLELTEVGQFITATAEELNSGVWTKRQCVVVTIDLLVRKAPPTRQAHRRKTLVSGYPLPATAVRSR